MLDAVLPESTVNILESLFQQMAFLPLRVKTISSDGWVKYSATAAASDMWQIWTPGQKRQCNSEGIRPDKNAFGKIKCGVLLHSNVLRCAMLQMILYVLTGRQNWTCCAATVYSVHLCVWISFSLSFTFKDIQNKSTGDHQRSSLQLSRLLLWVRATAAACSHLILSFPPSF